MLFTPAAAVLCAESSALRAAAALAAAAATAAATARKRMLNTWRSHAVLSPAFSPPAVTDVMLVGGSASAGADVPADRVYAPNALRIAGWPASRLANMAQGSARTLYSTLLLESLAAPLPRGVWIWEHAMNDVFRCASPAALACVLEAFLVRVAALRPALVVLLFLWPCGSPQHMHRARVDDRVFAACRSLIETYATKMPLVAINVGAWLRASPPAIESKFTVRYCHPSPYAHDMFAAIIAELLGNQSQPASVSSPADWTASPTTSSATPLTACANASIGARESELVRRVAGARAILSFNAWRPSLFPAVAAGNQTPATWLAARVTDAASGSAPRDLPPIGDCDVRGRKDCKRSVELPDCASGALYFALPRHTHISALHYKSSVAANITWTASGVEELSPTAAELHEVKDPCFATVDGGSPALQRAGVTRERWWLPDAPVPARGLRLCAQTPGAALHWLAVADAAHSRNLQ